MENSLRQKTVSNMDLCGNGYERLALLGEIEMESKKISTIE